MKMLFVIKFEVLLVVSGWFFVFLVAENNNQDVVALKIDKRGVTSEELKSERKNDQNVKESNKRDYYYIPAGSSGYGRPQFSSTGYDSTGVSGPSNYDTNYPHPQPDNHHHHYKPSYYDQGLITPPEYHHHYPPTGGHTTTITKTNTFALKSILIPIAGLAILGAAAALSTNPVLLQLGVVKGRRRKRSPSAERNGCFGIKNADEKVTVDYSSTSASV